MGDPDPEHAEVLADLPIDSFEGVPADMLCCVCLQPSLKNVTCCASGHNACVDCADRLTNGRCPQSCGPLLKPDGAWIRNVPLNSLLRETQLKCPNVTFGCDHKLKISDMAAHVAVCDHREVRCPCSHAREGASGCQWKGPYCQLQAHIRAVDHSKYMVDILLKHELQFADLHRERNRALDHVKDRFAGVERWQSAQAERDRSLSEQLAGFKRVLDKVEEHTNKRDGSSRRSIQRHNQLTNQNENLEADVADLTRQLACDADEIERLHAQVDSLREERDDVAARLNDGNDEIEK